MKPWQNDKTWSDQFIPSIRDILARSQIVEAPPDEDQFHNTDMLVLKTPQKRIACRLRRLDQLLAYGHQFTIRSFRPSGIETELKKILDGWGDYFFYGFGDNGPPPTIPSWLLGDLEIFRDRCRRASVFGLSDGLPGVEITNRDGTKFRAIAIAELPGNFVIARSESPPIETTSHPVIEVPKPQVKPLNIQESFDFAKPTRLY